MGKVKNELLFKNGVKDEMRRNDHDVESVDRNGRENLEKKVKHSDDMNSNWMAENEDSEEDTQLEMMFEERGFETAQVECSRQ